MPILGVIDSGKSGHLVVPNSYYSIATANGTGSSGTITFSSIPQTYSHLQIRYMAKGTSTAGGYPTSSNLYFNGDTNASNHSSHNLRGDGSSVAGGGGPGADAPFAIPGSYGSWSSSSILGVGVIDILDYTNTNKNKVIRTITGADANGTGGVLLMSDMWINTSAITSISIVADSTYIGNWSSNSQFALYGIK